MYLLRLFHRIVKRGTRRSRLAHCDFYEIYCKCDLEECEKRGPKRLYARARKGEIENLTGIFASYEEPIKPDMVVNTNQLSVEEEVCHIYSNLTALKLLEPS